MKTHQLSDLLANTYKATRTLKPGDDVEIDVPDGTQFDAPAFDALRTGLRRFGLSMQSEGEGYEIVRA